MSGAPLDEYVGADSGSVYAYGFNGVGWGLDKKFAGSFTDSNDQFGGSISMEGGKALIGEYAYGGGYVFRNTAGEWVEEGRLDWVGEGIGYRRAGAVGLSGDTAAIGGPQGSSHPGTAVVYQFDGVRWGGGVRLVASDRRDDDYFGIAVAISDDILVVGSDLDSPDGVLEAGSAYLFRFDGTDWLEESKISASDKAIGDRIGSALAMSGDTIVVGAPFIDIAQKPWAGAAYVFAVNCRCLRLEVYNLVAGGWATFTLTEGTPGARAATLYGFVPGRTSVGDYAGYCATFGMKTNHTKVIGGLEGWFNADGEMEFQVRVPEGLGGLRLFFQSAQRGTCPDECVSNLVKAVVE